MPIPMRDMAPSAEGGWQLMSKDCVETERLAFFHTYETALTYCTLSVETLDDC